MVLCNGDYRQLRDLAKWFLCDGDPWSSVGLCVEVVCVGGREVSDIDGLPRPPRHLLTQWLSHNTRQASYLVRLFDTCHSW